LSTFDMILSRIISWVTRIILWLLEKLGDIIDYFGLFDPPDIENLKSTGNLRGLIKALDHSDQSVRKRAAEALGEVGTPKATEPLIDSINDWNKEMRQAVISALVKIGTPAVYPLIHTLKDPDEVVRVGAVTTLGLIGHVRALEPLATRMQNDESVRVRLASYSALDQIQGGSVAEAEIQNLVEAVATEIRRLYSRTRTDIHYITTHTQFDPSGYISPDVEVEVERHDPDMSGIRTLIALIPETLRDRVRERSGEVKDEGSLWP
jgi:hypothetical protein